jgi:hypothetical protein
MLKARSKVGMVRMSMEWIEKYKGIEQGPLWRPCLLKMATPFVDWTCVSDEDKGLSGESLFNSITILASPSASGASLYLLVRVA